MEIVKYLSNGNELNGILSKVNDNDEVVIICHARLSHKDSRPTVRISDEFNKNDLNTFRFDFVYCGDSQGELSDYTVTNMVKNLEDTILMLKERYGYKNISLIGCSMGGRIVSLIDDKKYGVNNIILWYPALDYGRMGIKGLINLPGKKELVAKKQGYYVMESGKKLSYEYFKDERNYLTYKHLEKKDIPLLFVHGTKDIHVPCESSIKISKLCKNSELFLVNGGDHGFHDDNSMIEAVNVTNSFLNKYRKYPKTIKKDEIKIDEQDKTKIIEDNIDYSMYDLEQQYYLDNELVEESSVHRR